MTYVCDAGDSYNRFESDFTQDNLTLGCLPNNKFQEVEWPTCADGKKIVETFSYFTYFFAVTSCPNPSNFTTGEITTTEVFDEDPVFEDIVL